MPDLTLAVINANYALPAGLNPSKDALIVESADNPFVNIFVTRGANLKDPRIAKLQKIYQSADNEKFILDHFKGTILPAWK
jgi:D-methionine transport system substrate-binding protein